MSIIDNPIGTTISSLLGNNSELLGESTTVAAVTPSIDGATVIVTHKPNILVRVTTESGIIMDPLSHVGDGIFLQTKTAQGIAGVFVWVALFITCQQVRYIFLFLINIYQFFILYIFFSVVGKKI